MNDGKRSKKELEIRIIILRVAYNSIFREIFGYSYHESVTNLQHALHRPTWEELSEKKCAKFATKCSIFPVDSLTRTLYSISMH